MTQSPSQHEPLGSRIGLLGREPSGVQPRRPCRAPRLDRISLTSAVLILVLAICCPIHARSAGFVDDPGTTQGTFKSFEATADSADQWQQVGIAKRDITPDYPIRLNGFGGRHGESLGARHSIWAKAIAIGADADPDGPAILFTLDSLGIRLDMVDEIAAQLAERRGIKRERIALTFTHSHTTPKVNGASDNIYSSTVPEDEQSRIDQYSRELTEHLIEVGCMALDAREPSRLEWGVGTVGFAINRRTTGGPVDHSLPVLTIRNRDGDLRGVYVTYACHCVTLSDRLISGDWAGFAQDSIERRFPECIAMVSIGAGSDSNPSSGVTGDKGDIAAEQGAQIADEVARVIARPMIQIDGALSTRLELIELPLNELPTRDALQEMAALGGAAGYNAQTQIARLDRGDGLLSSIRYPIQTWEFADDLLMVFLAGEVCVDYSLRLKTELDRTRLWVTAYSNDFCGYIPSERLLREGGYGGGSEIPYFAWPTTLKEGVEQQIIDHVKSMVPEDYLIDEGTEGIPPRSPESTLSTMRLDDAFSIEVVASEPLIRDPVAIEFDFAGGLYVVEMPDYSRAVDADFDPAGVVKWIHDHDGDGTFEHATVFASGFRFPTDVKTWRDGILVCDAPDILFLRDETGDGIADHREVLFTGFATHNPHARVNSLRWGLDGWLYGSGGLFGGLVRNQAGETVDVSGRDFRLNPDTGQIEPVTGRSQQGRARNDWGDWFGCDNSSLMRYYAIEASFARRVSHVAPPASAIYVPTGPDADRLYPPNEIVTFALSGPPGRPTSVCGLEVYRDVVLGEAFDQNVFVCEPVNQLIHRRMVTRHDTVYRGVRADSEQAREFLVSVDQWFRPVQVRMAPDGGLLVVDMYRYVIEHPRWIPDETKSELDLTAGTDRGRIYRVFPDDGSSEPPNRINLRDAQPAEIALAIRSTNGVVRDMAHQMIAWNYDSWPVASQRAAVAELQSIIHQSSHDAARIQAFAILNQLDALRGEDLNHLWDSTSSEVRAHVVRVLPSWLAMHSSTSDEFSMWRDRLMVSIETDPPFVAMQIGYALGDLDADESSEMLAFYLQRFVDNEYLSYAGKTSISRHNLDQLMKVLLATVESNHAEPSEESERVIATVLSLIPILAAIGEPAHGQITFDLLMSDAAYDVSDEGVSDQRNVKRVEQLAALFVSFQSEGVRLFDQLGDERKSTFGTYLDRIAGDLQNDEHNDARFVIAVMRLMTVVYRLDAEFQSNDYFAAISERLAVSEPPAVQLAAIESLYEIGNEAAFDVLIANLESIGPTSAAAIQRVICSRPDWLSEMITRLEDGRVDLKRLNHQQLLVAAESGNETNRQRITTLLGQSGDSGRTALVERYLRESPDDTNPIRGEILFAEHCSTCHRLGDSTESVGPDLAALTQRTPRALIESILDPNRDVDRRYVTTIVEDDQGRVHSGLIVEESDFGIVIQHLDETRSTIRRDSIESLTTTSISFMPEGLEETLNPDQLADVLSYLQGALPGPLSFAGNAPSQVSQGDQGELTLNAETAAIYGTDIRYEGAPYFNIGFWHHATDHVAWDVDLQLGGRFEVWMQYACHENTSGNRLQIHFGVSTIECTVPSTQTWDQYRMCYLGTIEMSAGRNRIIAHSKPPHRGALIDLRRLELLPVDETADADDRVSVESSRRKIQFDRMQEGVVRAGALRDDMLKGAGSDDASSELSRLDVLVEQMILFQQHANERLQGRRELSEFDLSQGAVQAKVDGDPMLADWKPFDSFAGRWFGTWDQMQVDHWWHPVRRFEVPWQITQEAPTIVETQFAWIGDGFGWNYVAISPQTREPIILGMVYHVDSEDSDQITLERPHIGVAMGPNRLIWITAKEVFFEEAFGEANDRRYAITGFHYRWQDGRVVRHGEAFQATYTRSPDDRPEFFRF